MANPASNTSTRPMLNTMNEDYIVIRHRPKISEKYKCCLKINGICYPCTCLYCKAEEIYQSTYVQVLENRLEWNYPGPKCYPICCCCLKDKFGVLYLDDRTVKKVARLRCCSPVPCITGWCPNKCDLWGEAVIIYNCCGCGCRPCCFESHTLRYLEDADILVEQIKEAIKARNECGGGAPAPVEMSI